MNRFKLSPVSALALLFVLGCRSTPASHVSDSDVSSQLDVATDQVAEGKFQGRQPPSPAEFDPFAPPPVPGAQPGKGLGVAKDAHDSTSDAETEALVREMKASGSPLSAQAEQQLRWDLEATPPGLRHLVVQGVRASLAHKSAQPERAATPKKVAPADANEVVPTSATEQEAAQVIVALHAEKANEAPANVEADSASSAPPAGDAATASEFEKPRSDVPAELPLEVLSGAMRPLSGLAKPGAGTDQTPLATSSASRIPAATPDDPSSARANFPANARRADGSESEEGSDVIPAAFASDSPDVWRSTVDAAIRQLEQATKSPPTNAAESEPHVHLRLLYLIAGRRDDALKPIPGLPVAHQDFWSLELYGLAAWLDARRQPVDELRASTSAAQLQQAATRLGQAGNLAVKNLALCTEISSYGTFTPFEKDEFQPGQQVLLYCEVENYKVAQTPQGHHTSLAGSYQILDAQGRRVHADDLPATEEYCQNPRRDYFIPYALYLPAKIYEGKYKLELSIEDTLSRRIGQATIDFSIAGSRPPRPNK